MKAQIKTSGLRSNLSDAGVSDDIAETILTLAAGGRKSEQLRLLKAHRATLLATLREAQRRIDCLDYLIFSMTRQSE